MNDKYEIIYATFGLTGTEQGEISVRCPFHGDTNASASINVTTGKYNCHAAGCKSFHSFDALAEALGVTDVQSEPAPNPTPVMLESFDIETHAITYLESRGFPIEELTGVTASVDDEMGYLTFSNDRNQQLGRNLFKNDNPKYLNPAGPKGMFFMDTYDTRASHVWITEGIFDALSLVAMGYTNVVTSLGAKVPEKALFQIRHQTAFILFDNDWDGWSGARKAAKALNEMGGNPIILDIPVRFGTDTDVNEAWLDDQKLNRSANEMFVTWVNRKYADLSATDSAYVDRFMDNDTPLQVIPTGFATLNHLLGGGLKDGLHVIGAEPGIGKTSLAVHFAVTAATVHGKKVLIVTYEDPKRQFWSRVASTHSAFEWPRIEVQPSLLKSEPKVQAFLRTAAQNIRVVVGWNFNKVRHVMADFDVVILDYLQKMPGKPGVDDDTSNTAWNIRQASDIARDKGKVIIAISELNRAGYGRLTLSVFKESGAIEYSASSALVLLTDPTTSGTLIAHLLKNSRGVKGKFGLTPNLAHQRFVEASVL